MEVFIRSLTRHTPDRSSCFLKLAGRVCRRKSIDTNRRFVLHKTISFECRTIFRMEEKRWVLKETF